MKKLLRSTAMVLALGGFALPVHAQNANTNETNQLANASSGSQGFCDRSWDQIDANSDGMVDKTEVTGAADARFKQIDTDGNGALTIEEFETLHNDFMRERMVDAFQALDADGDGEISTEELDTRVDRLVDRMDRNDDGAISPEDRRR